MKRGKQTHFTEEQNAFLIRDGFNDWESLAKAFREKFDVFAHGKSVKSISIERLSWKLRARFQNLKAKQKKESK